MLLSTTVIAVVVFPFLKTLKIPVNSPRKIVTGIMRVKRRLIKITYPIKAKNPTGKNFMARTANPIVIMTPRANPIIPPLKKARPSFVSKLKISNAFLLYYCYCLTQMLDEKSISYQ